MNVLLQMILAVASPVLTAILNVVMTILMYIFCIPIYFVRFAIKHGFNTFYYIPLWIAGICVAYVATSYIISTLLLTLWKYVN